MLAADGYGLLSALDVAAEATAAFDCGKPHLNDFLKSSAQPMHQQRLGFTSVVFHRDFQGVVGYFTLANDAIPLKTSERDELGVEFDLPSFPAVKIGRLAIAAALQGQGSGSAVMKLILGEVLDAKSLSSARLLIVDADNQPEVVRFYEKMGFERSLWAEDQVKNHGGKRVAKTVKMMRDVLTRI